MPGRGYTAANGYRYGFNGKEKDDEVKGNGNEYDFGARIYDPRMGRWFSTDPLQTKYPDWSPYCFAINSPIMWLDMDGRDIIPAPQISYTGTSTPVYANDLGSTFVGVTTSAIPNKKTNSYDIQVNIYIQYSSLYSGPSQFNADNLGLKEETEAHEWGHYEQVAEVAKNSDITITYAGKKYTGKIDVVFNAAVKDVTASIDKKYAGKTFSSEAELKKATKQYENEINQAKIGVLTTATTALQDKITEHQVDGKGQSQPGIEEDANKRAFKTLADKKIPVKFLNSSRAVKFNGKILPWKTSDQTNQKSR